MADWWKHKKRGTLYDRIGAAELQSSSPIEEGTVLTLYQDRDGKTWARPVQEFYDGRFEKVK